MSTRGSYSPRKLGTIIDMAHIIIGILIMVMACFAILRPARYMFLFPLIFFLASLLSFFNSWFGTAAVCTYRDQCDLNMGQGLIHDRKYEQ